MFDKIKYGIKNNKFYVTIPGLQRKVGNMREEFLERAKELSQYKKLAVSLSSGLDSQCIVHTFKELSIPIETFFLYLPGYNDNEYENLQVIEKKYNLKTVIVNIDINKLKEQILYESEKYNNHPNSILHKIFLTCLPDDINLITINYDPYLYKSKTKGELYIFDYQQAEYQRDRAFDLVDRVGMTFDFGNTSEIIYSVITDNIFRSAMIADNYLKNNGLIAGGTDVPLKSLGRYDYFIKPLLYGKYWKDELIYFPKFVGWENIDWLKTAGYLWKTTCLVSYYDLIKNLEDGVDATYYENIEELKNLK